MGYRVSSAVKTVRSADASIRELSEKPEQTLRECGHPRSYLLLSQQPLARPEERRKWFPSTNNKHSGS
jgi:hypothetical protein